MKAQSRRREQHGSDPVAQTAAAVPTDSPNQAWGIDFVADQLVDGRRFRALTVLDISTRESLAIEVGRKLKGADGRDLSCQLAAAD